MSVTIQLDLPEDLIQQARQMGLLDNQRMAELLTNEVRRANAGQESKRSPSPALSDSEETIDDSDPFFAALDEIRSKGRDMANHREVHFH